MDRMQFLLLLLLGVGSSMCTRHFEPLFLNAAGGDDFPCDALRGRLVPRSLYITCRPGEEQ